MPRPPLQSKPLMGNNTKKPTNLSRELRDYVMIAVGMASYALGWNIFLLPAQITAQGVPGISSIVFWGTGIPPQYTYFAINCVLMIAALIILGWRFCLKTIFAIITITCLTSLLSPAMQNTRLLVDQPFMDALIGAILCGSGIGLAFSYGGSSGGTDIIASIVNKYRNISLGRVVMLCDIVIITSSYLVVHSWDKVIFGYVVLCVSSFCIDQVVDMRRKNVQFFVISDKYEEIAHQIGVYPHRGVTVIPAYGYYTGKERKMLFIMASRREKNVVFSLIRDIDPDAFVTESNVQAVYGQGFDKFKTGKKRPLPSPPR